MTEELDKLVKIGSASILSPSLRGYGALLPACLVPLYERRNGLYAFESALHVFPVGEAAGTMDLFSWNKPDLWRNTYEDLVAPDWVFFAEDLFGGQFVVTDGGARFGSFDPETGRVEHFASDVEGWAKSVLADYRVITGQPLAHDWQTVNGTLPVGRRLLPKVPFVMEGEFSVSNLYAGDAVTGMRFRASIARQIKDLPPGTPVTWKVVD